MEAAILEFPAQPVETATEIALVDLSSIAYPVFLMSGSEPDPDFTSREIVARVRSLTANHLKAAICCDSGRSFRKDLSPDYKANRDAQPQALYHQIKLACEQLEADGYPVWKVKGFEADDLIASAARQAFRCGASVLVLSADKDLLQLVGPCLTVKSTITGTAYNREGVRAKFGVDPEQVVDYLALVGDAADNIKGAAGIGKVKAADLLNRFNDLETVYQVLDEHGTHFKPAMATALREFQPRMEQTRELIELRYDVPIPFGELDNERAPKGVAMEDEMATEAPALPVIETTAVSSNGNGNHAPVNVEKPGPATQGVVVGPGAQVVARVEPATSLAPAPAEFERQLEPRSIGQAMQLANAMHKARMFNGYGTPEAVLSTVLAGRELGLQAIASLRGFHVIEGKHALAADAMRGLVLRSGQAKYFRVIERTAEVATFETWRASDPEPVRLSYSVAEGRAAFGFTAGMNEKALAEKEAKWSASGWGKHTADMLAARASSKLARLVYADILFGLYSPEELRD